MVSRPGAGIPGTIADAQELTDNKDDSITKITEVMTTVHMASKTNTQTVGDGINMMRKEVATVRAEVQASR